MQKIQAKQVHRLLQSCISVSVEGVSAATSVTADLVAAVTGAGWRDTNVPNQAYGAPTYPLTAASDLDEEVPGWRVDGDNRVELWIAGTEEKLVSSTGEEVYGRLTDAATGNVDLFTLIGSTETAYELEDDVDLVLDLPYVFSFDTLPLTALGGGVSKISQDPSGNTYVVAELTLASAVTQTFDPLTIKRQGTDATVNVNGQVHEFITEAFTFGVDDITVTWDAAVAGFAIDAADTVTIRYAV
jgi:hypothetical protein